MNHMNAFASLLAALSLRDSLGKARGGSPASFEDRACTRTAKFVIGLTGSLALIIGVSMPIAPSKAENARIQHYTHAGCEIGGRRVLPAGADIGLVATFQLPQGKQQCLDAVNRMKAGCEMATHFQGTDPDGRPWNTGEKDLGCLDAFRAEIPQCIQHYERESQKCHALVSDEERERREIEDELERLAIEEELAKLAVDEEVERLAIDEQRRRLAVEEERRRLAVEEERRRLAAEEERRRVAAKEQRQRLAAEAEQKRRMAELEHRRRLAQIRRQQEYQRAEHYRENLGLLDMLDLFGQAAQTLQAFDNVMSDSHSTTGYGNPEVQLHGDMFDEDTTYRGEGGQLAEPRGEEAVPRGDPNRAGFPQTPIPRKVKR